MFGVAFSDLIINGKSTNICAGAKHPCLITVDSGTTLMSMPKFATDILA
jgi:hypothetical protein